MKLLVQVSFDPLHGYVGLADGLEAQTALSLSGLRRRIEAALLPVPVEIKLVLDRAARLERDARRSGGPIRASDYVRAR